ncbi:MAG: adenylyltransferase [Candidatus Latescibacterota bacterium]|nr:MAG: adenylyltransferase [Candidatus Latescibacterota bacterium]
MWLRRYGRQVTVPGWDQEKLGRAHVAVVGAGGLGSAVLYYLVAAGVGRIAVVDGDAVEESNLNRQVLHFTSDVGRRKVESALEKLEALNPEVTLEPLAIELTAENVAVLGNPDVLVDALDNLKSRLIVNRYAVENRMPLVHAAVEGFQGLVTTVVPGRTPCLACIYPDPKERGTFPVVGATAGLLGLMEAAEVLKLLLGLGEVLSGRLLMVDILSWEFRNVRTKFRRSCPVCGGREDG